MIEISYAESWNKARSTPKALQPTAIPWEVKNPMPPSSYVFRSRNGDIIKQYTYGEHLTSFSFAKPGTEKTIAHKHDAHQKESERYFDYEYRYLPSINSNNKFTKSHCSADANYRYQVFSSDGKIGLIDTLGNLVADTIYTQLTCADSIYYFSTNYKTGIMTKDLKVKFPAEHDYIRYFDKGLYCVTDYHYYGFIDKNGKEITPVKYYGSPGEFVDGLLMVLEVKTNERNKWGFIDSTGKEIIELKYESLQPFHNGLAVAKLNGKFGFINHKGETVIDFKYDYIQVFVNGFAEVSKNNKYGMINTKGEEVIPCKYTILENFSEGLAAASKASTGGPYIGYINTKNEIVIPFMYENAWPFKNGKAKVQKGGKEIYINKKGIEVPGSFK